MLLMTTKLFPSIPRMEAILFYTVKGFANIQITLFLIQQIS